MKTYYTISLGNQLRSFKYGFIFAASTLAGGMGGMLFRDFDADERLVALVVTCSFFLVFCIPAIILHIAYYNYNKSTSLTLDGGKIEINHRGNEYKYHRADLKAASKYLSTLYENAVRPMPWSNYGYILLEFNDGKRFFITSLMIDVNKADFYSFLTYYANLPSFDKSNYKTERLKNAKVEDIKKTKVEDISAYVETFKTRFAAYPTEELQEKIDSAERYEEAAIIAAKQILAERGYA